MSKLLKTFALSLLVLTGACGKTSESAEASIAQTHIKQVRSWVTRTLVRHRKGVMLAAQRLAPGFEVEPEETRRAQMRIALKLMGQPPRGVSELIASPKSFLAAVDTKGIVLARDAQASADRMQGRDLSALSPILRAVRGQPADGLVVFPSLDAGEPSVSLVFAHPISLNKQQVGTLVVGIPLWRLAQQFSQQLRLTYAKHADLVLWVYLYHENRIHHFGTPPELDQALPPMKKLRAELKRTPDGFTTSVNVVGRPYAVGVYPLPTLSPQTGVIIVRSDPS